MYSTSDIYPVSDFNRKPAEHIRRLQETKTPEVLTVNGKAAVVMVDPETYDQLAKDAELVKTLNNIALANEQHEKGLARPIDEVFKDLKEDLKAKYPDTGGDPPL
ncbi:MAG: type II toxin-antitoxin system Phd/YefM family antitoxin [Pseudomonadales bacterium]